MPAVSGAVVPHAPLLLPQVTEVRRAPSVVAAARMSFEAPVILVSPHGPAPSVHGTAEGALDAFGVPGVCAGAPGAPELARELARLAGWSVDGAPADHGVVVPLALGLEAPAVVAVSLSETTGPRRVDNERALDEAADLAAALAELDDRVAVVASAHTSAALTPRAPLAQRPAGRALDDAILSALRSDVGDLARIPAEMWREGGSCGGGPLSVLGRLFAGRSATVAAYEYPVGVGYVVAKVDGAG